MSFLVILVNLLVFETWGEAFFASQSEYCRNCDFIVVLIYGFWVTGQKKNYPTVSVGVVQPNIPLAVDWDEGRKPWIIAKTIRLTQKLQGPKIGFDRLAGNIFAGRYHDAPFLTNEIRATAAGLHTPILIGSMAKEGERYYNSAFLIGADGQMLGRYDKIHLVPFGEYLPLRPILGWINKIVPLDDFTSGKTYKVFSIVAFGPRSLVS